MNDIEVLNERKICAICTDCTDKDCLMCDKVNGSTLAEMELAFDNAIKALEEKAERDKMRCENCKYGCPADYGICSCSAHKMIDTDYDTYCSYFILKESEGNND